ncbi:MAG: hypothetical protein H0T46_28445 [Deltaproteobacteria bacterium]|nr:hypothetical protein [Deltaproteobacteria bacterium]
MIGFRWLWVVAIVLVAGACQRDKADATAAPERGSPGKERGDCKPNKVCDPGLLCLSNLCVRPPPADCKAIGEQLASIDLGNYAEAETRAPVVAKYTAACEKAYVSKEQGDCMEKATDKWSASQCAPDMFPELKTAGGAGDCATIANRIRAQMGKQMSGADPQTAQLFTKMMTVIQTSCEQDKWPGPFKQCVLAAGDNQDSMNKCNGLMPAEMQQKMTERMSKMM